MKNIERIHSATSNRTPPRQSSRKEKCASSHISQMKGPEQGSQCTMQWRTKLLTLLCEHTIVDVTVNQDHMLTGTVDNTRCFLYKPDLKWT